MENKWDRVWEIQIQTRVPLGIKCYCFRPGVKGHYIAVAFTDVGIFSHASIIHIHSASFFSVIHFFSDHLFVSDWRSRSVYRMRKRDGGNISVLRQGITGVMNVKAYSADLQGCESWGWVEHSIY